MPKGAKAEIIGHSGVSFFKLAAAPHAMKSASLFGVVVVVVVVMVMVVGNTK